MEKKGLSLCLHLLISYYHFHFVLYICCHQMKDRDSPWIQNTHYPVLDHKNGAYYLERRPNETIKISDEKLSELMRK